MKFKKKIVCTMGKEEVAAIEKAADIISDICYTYDDENACSDCPLFNFCKKITTNEHPHELMYDLWRILKDLM